MRCNNVILLKTLANLAPKSDIRYFLNGVLLKQKDGALSLSVTEGKYLVSLDIDLEYRNKYFDIETTNNFEHILDRISLLTLLKMYTAKDAPIISISDSSVKIEEFEIILIDGRYPDTDRILNEDTYSRDNPFILNVCPILLSALSTAFSKLTYTMEMETGATGQSLRYTSAMSYGKLTAVMMGRKEK